MIIDSSKNTGLYEPLHPLFAKAFEYIRTQDLAALQPGEYPIDGKKLFAIISEVNLRDTSHAPLEVHDKYIDIQLVLEGEEPTVGGKGRNV